MTKTIAIALVLILSVCLLTGCRSKQQATNPTEATMDLMPDRNDTIDPSNGENRPANPTTTTDNGGELPHGRSKFHPAH